MPTLYGIGIGSGDPELLTLKAIRIIKECDVIVAPTEDIINSVAYRTCVAVIPEIEGKELIGIKMPMVKNEVELKDAHNKGADIIISKLSEGKNVACLTLGDPTVFSTFTYIQEIVKEKGYDTAIVSGIASFLSAAALVNSKLVIRDEAMHIISGTYGIDEILELSGTRVIMKAGKQLGHIKQKLNGADVEVCFIENCGMENERIIRGLDNLPDSAGYYSIVIVSDRDL